jgi:putative lipoic acid-binding regulatory protein
VSEPDGGGGGGAGDGGSPPGPAGGSIESAQEAAQTRAAASPGAPQPPLIQFPTFYTFKAMGLTGTVRDRVLELVGAVLGAVDPSAVTVRPSSAGKYESISVHVYLRSEDERRRIYESFHREKAIVWYV